MTYGPASVKRPCVSVRAIARDCPRQESAAGTAPPDGSGTAGAVDGADAAHVSPRLPAALDGIRLGPTTESRL